MIGLRVLEHNCNNKNSAHGDLFKTLANIVLGKTSNWNETSPTPLVTTSLTTDYLGATRLGDCIDSADFHRIGRNLAFIN